MFFQNHNSLQKKVTNITIFLKFSEIINKKDYNIVTKREKGYSYMKKFCNEGINEVA